MRTSVLLALAVLTLQPQPAEIRLIVKGDDMAAGHGINVATIDAYKRGVLTTTNVIVPGPWFPEAARMLRENPGLDAGVHLALTSEWENVKWRPLTHAPSIVDADGYFFPLVQPRPGFPSNTSIRESSWKLDEIERELRAQIEMARRHIPHVTYTWNHMGFPSVSPDVATLVARLSKEYGLVVPADLGIQPVGRVYEARDSGAVKADKLAARLETLGPGLWLHIDHAATDDPEMQAFGHVGYEWVAADRSAVLEAWTSPKVREVVTRRGIRLTNYRELTAGAR
ncbi:MAG TPA: ChbG/HpnK family deacetylase [Vicinamibacterales bacterium]|nr:ChbG/HpnK family deacetylase [Vicinamibacterales bacterium]